MSSALHTAYIALGSNLQDPQRQILAGFEALARLPKTQVIARSLLYRSAPVGYADQPDYVNAVAAIHTALAPRALLDALLAIERAHGRMREFVNAPRTLDLDIVLYEMQVIHEPGLSVPHPRMHERAFVLVPLAEIAPHVVVPGRGSVQELLHGVNVAGVQRVQAVSA